MLYEKWLLIQIAVLKSPYSLNAFFNEKSDAGELSHSFCF